LFLGGVLLLCYALGHGCLIVLCGTFTGLLHRLTSRSQYESVYRGAKTIIGLVVFLLGLYLIFIEGNIF